VVFVDSQNQTSVTKSSQKVLGKLELENSSASRILIFMIHLLTRTTIPSE